MPHGASDQDKGADPPDDEGHEVLSTKLIANQSGTLVKSGARMLGVLEYFFMVRRPVRAVDIATVLELPRSSASELLKTLVDTGYLSFNPEDRTYFPSFRFVRLGHWLSSFYFGPNRLMDLMEDLKAAANMPVALSMENGRHMQFVALMKSRDPLHRHSSPPEIVSEGLRMPIVGSACGSALLMTKTDHFVAQMYARAAGLKPAAVPPADLAAFIGAIRAFRQRGYATNPGALLPDNMSIAVPLPPAASGVAMVVGVGGDTDEVERREAELAAMLKDRVAAYFRA